MKKAKELGKKNEGKELKKKSDNKILKSYVKKVGDKIVLCVFNFGKHRLLKSFASPVGDCCRLRQRHHKPIFTNVINFDKIYQS
jgi:hypothetical protein